MNVTTIMEMAETIDMKNLDKSLVPRVCGVYAWIDKKDGRVVYSGTAIGQNGLRQRIWQQINPLYVEYEDKKNPIARPHFHLDHPVMNDDLQIFPKSELRMNLSLKYKLRAGAECATYLVDHFLLKVIPMHDSTGEQIKSMEQRIRYELKPELNCEKPNIRG